MNATGFFARRFLVAASLLMIVGTARHASAQAVCTDPTKATPEGVSAADAVKAAAGKNCLGWLDFPPSSPPVDPVSLGGAGRRKLDRGETLELASISSSISSAPVAGGAALGVGTIADELFTLIAQIAVERAQRQGLALIKRKIEDAVCTLPLRVPDSLEVWDPEKGEKHSNTYYLVKTCGLIRSTDLQALVGQADALRAALTDDLLSAAGSEIGWQLGEVGPLARSATAAVSLLKRAVADPHMYLTKNDVWLVADALLNSPWDAFPDGAHQGAVDFRSLEAKSGRSHDEMKEAVRRLQIAVASARVYLQALRWTATAQKDRVDLAFVIRTVETNNGLPVVLDGEQTQQIADWANLAVRAASALTADGTKDDFHQQLRSVLQLCFDAYELLARRTSLEQMAAGHVTSNVVPTTFVAWVRSISLAAVDGDAPHLIAAFADMAKVAVDEHCSGDCIQRRKVSALLTGVATYALTYARSSSSDATDQKAQTQTAQAQSDARKQALSSVIDAATDRRNRGGDFVVTLGIGVGGMLGGHQTLDAVQAAPQTIPKDPPKADAVPTTFDGQIHLPVGVAFQRLPASDWKWPIVDREWWRRAPFHIAINALDLGSYLARSADTNTTPQWTSILSPGLQVGLPIGVASNFVVVGYNWSYDPRFTTSPVAGDTSPRGASRRGWFVNYYVPLWDFK